MTTDLRLQPHRAGKVRRVPEAELRDPLELSLLASLLLILLYGDEHSYGRVALSTLAVAGLALPGLRRAPELWAAAAAVSFTSVALSYWTVDNHKYLIGYWLLSLSLALHTPAPRRVLARASRLLIGAAMGIAVTWKLFKPEFTRGAFFEHELLFNRWFAGIARSLGGLTPEQLQHNSKQLARLTGWLPATIAIVLISSAAVRRLALALTWWALALEGTIALSFLTPDASRWARLRDPLLITFFGHNLFDRTGVRLCIRADREWDRPVAREQPMARGLPGHLDTHSTVRCAVAASGALAFGTIGSDMTDRCSFMPPDTSA